MTRQPCHEDVWPRSPNAGQACQGVARPAAQQQPVAAEAMSLVGGIQMLAPARNALVRRATRSAFAITLRLPMTVVLAVLTLSGPASTGEAAEPGAAMDSRIQALIPDLEAYVAIGMTAFDNPGLAIGIVAGDELVYAKGFGVRKKGGEPVDTRTVFQIGSATKGFLATTMAIAVDRGRFRWDDRIVDLIRSSS